MDDEWGRDLRVVAERGMKKTIVIGLDGANWDLIAPWIKSGDLPNIQYLMENGSWGDSESQKL